MGSLDSSLRQSLKNKTKTKTSDGGRMGHAVPHTFNPRIHEVSNQPKLLETWS